MKRNPSFFYSRLFFLLLLTAGVAWLPRYHVLPANNGSPANKTPVLLTKKKIIFIAGACSHGAGEHEHNAGCRLLAGELNKSMGDVSESIVYQGWPADTTVLNSASAIVLYMDGGDRHLAIEHLEHLQALMNKGIGFTCLHYAVEVPTDRGGPEFKKWLGGYFETFWSVNPTWQGTFDKLPRHPVTNGVQPFSLKDEWYYHMRFADNMKNVTPILTAIPPASTLDRADGPHEGNPAVRAEKGKPQTVAWVTTRSDGGRGFGFTGGHYHQNWGNQQVRKLVLNGIAWTAKLAIPNTGVPTESLSDSELQANLDVKPCKR